MKARVTKSTGAWYDLLTEEEYFEVLDTLPDDNQHLDDKDPNKFVAKMGAAAVFDLLERLELHHLSNELRHKASVETSQQRKSEALKRLRVVEAFKEGQKDFDIPESWHQARQGKLNPETPFNFVCTADIIGGNSGRPSYS